MVAAAAAAGMVAQPDAAQAFVYNGKEYFDVTFGISPLAWGFAAFAILFYGATVKNAAQKYNKPWGTNTIKAPLPPKMGGKFVGLEIENKVDSYKAGWEPEGVGFSGGAPRGEARRRGSVAGSDAHGLVQEIWSSGACCGKATNGGHWVTAGCLSS